jgi:hypothetical protein
MLSNTADIDSIDIVTCEDIVQDNLAALAFCYILVVASLCQNMYYFTMFARSIRDIMIRQRAPWIAVVQSISYFSVIAIQFFVELLLKSGVLVWDKTPDGKQIESPKDVALSRIILKTIFGLFRLNIVIIIPYR